MPDVVLRVFCHFLEAHRICGLVARADVLVGDALLPLESLASATS